MAAGDVGTFTFHPICGADVELSKEKRVAIGKGYGHNFAFSNDPIPIGLQFSVKILKKSFRCIYVSPISASSKPHINITDIMVNITDI